MPPPFSSLQPSHSESRPILKRRLAISCTRGQFCGTHPTRFVQLPCSLGWQALEAERGVLQVG